MKNPEDINASQIKSMRIQFTPSYKRTPMEGVTRAMFRGVEFKRWGGDPYNPQNTLGEGKKPIEPDNDDDNYVDPNA